MMSVAEYRKHPAFSYSSLKAYLKSPLHGISQRPPADSASLRFGRNVDMILKGDTESFVVNPFEDGRTTAAKQWKTENSQKMIDKTILTQAEFEKATLCVAAIAAHPLVQGLSLSMMSCDVPMFGEFDGVPIKGLPDYIFGGTIFDLKTTADDVDAKSFARTVDKFHYDLQAFIYTELARQTGETNPTFGWIAVENDHPFDVAVYFATPEIFAIGKRKLELALRNVKLAQQGKLHGVAQASQELVMPTWYGNNL